MFSAVCVGHKQAKSQWRELKSVLGCGSLIPVHFSIYVIVVLHDGGQHKRPKHVAADKWMSKSVVFVIMIKTDVEKFLN